ncbi:DUF6124 family protein [Pseudomonas frederiksbergensis]|uniref:DUF6124 family protein n=1 Tax=Pseudomonas frederiksbergensis TaxID=104087 RepID=UPI0026AAD7D2
MKKFATKSAESPNVSPNDTIDSSRPAKVAEQLVSVPLRTHTRPASASYFFAVVPDVDTEALLCHASETLASLSVMATDLARELEGPRRHVIVGIQQLSALGNCWSIERWTTWSRPGDRLKVVQLPVLNNRVPFPNGGFLSWIDTCPLPASTATSHHC